jgi:hypothetical protein
LAGGGARGPEDRQFRQDRRLLFRDDTATTIERALGTGRTPDANLETCFRLSTVPGDHRSRDAACAKCRARRRRPSTAHAANDGAVVARVERRRGRHRRTKRVRKLLALSRAIRTPRCHGPLAFGGGLGTARKPARTKARVRARPESKGVHAPPTIAQVLVASCRAGQTASREPLGSKHWRKSSGRSRLAGVAASLVLSRELDTLRAARFASPAIEQQRWRLAAACPASDVHLVGSGFRLASTAAAPDGTNSLLRGSRPLVEARRSGLSRAPAECPFRWIGGVCSVRNHPVL